ncbi:DUF2059 domain-containing protein [Paracoccus sp. YIM 132242]|uniref:DUF2059 domain-containing protein n=1 Tax=Paracoccus lichenicola TaxID=2665644 RepID=A0A6L6HIE8_9RHOB|nr:DUF2059 domain-containing protein [Paracoccus lichenicola]MTD98926.1 DUF2059 domain-containing protein [Paracoccus lichenicola]
MLRFLCLSLLIALAGPVAAQPQTPLPQHRQAADAVWEVMDLDSLAPVLQAEAVAEGEEMAATLFQGRGTGRWLDRVGAIHHPARIKALFLAGMAAAMPGTDPAQVRAGLDFYRTGFGQRMLALESSARVAMLDGDVEAAAREALAQARRRGDPRAAQIDRLIETADLIEPNVAGGLNAAIAFSRGFQAGGGFPMPMTEAEIIRDAWAQEPQMRAETEDWIGAYLFLAYSSLSDAELDGYIAYAGSAGGQALSRLMFAGFDAVFGQTSHDMGLAAASEIRARPL